MNTIRTLERRESIRVTGTALAAWGLISAVWSNSAQMQKLSLVAAMFVALPIQAQTTAFNFQGRLSNLGLPVNGYHDLRFSVYGSQAGADLVSGPITVSSVAVRGGIFHCRLDFGEQVFNGSARWLDISVRPVGTASFTALSPRVELTSAPYAVRAKEAAVAASVANGSAVKSVNNLKDNVNLAAGANVTLTTNGNTLTIGATAGGGGGLWSTQNTNVYYTGGNVGIGTSQPQGILDVNGGASDTSALYVRADPSTFGRGGLIHHQSSTYGWQELAQTTGSATDGLLAFNYVNRTAPASKISSNVLTLRGNGNVGIGTNFPTSKLEIVGAQDALKISGYQPVITLRDSSFSNVRAAIQSVQGGLNLFSGTYLDGINPFAFIRLAYDGSVGIGAANPASPLEVASPNRREIVRLIGPKPYLTLFDSSAGYARGRLETGAGSVSLQTEGFISGLGLAQGALYLQNGTGNVGISTDNPAHKLTVIGEGAAGYSIGITGNATQNRDKGGWVKAMAKVNADASVDRQFSAFGGNITATKAPNQTYVVTFPFQVSDRFVSVTPIVNESVGSVEATIRLGSGCAPCGPNTIQILVWSDLPNQYVANEFFIFVY